LVRGINFDYKWKKEVFELKRKKFTKFERIFPKIHVQFGFQEVFLCSKERRKFLKKKDKNHEI
jgi:hypothetical protein